MKVIDIALKDLTQTLRSGFAVGMMVVAPLLLIGLIYFAFGGPQSATADATPPKVEVGIVDLDTLPDGAPLDQSLGSAVRSMFVDPSVETWITARDYADVATAREAVDAQQIGVAVIIPAGYTADVLAGRDAAVTVLSDPTLTVGPQIAEAMVRTLMQGFAGGGIALDTVRTRLQANGQDPAALDPAILMDDYSAWYAETQRAMLHQTEQAALITQAPAAVGATSDAMTRQIAQMAAGQMVFFAFFTGAFSMMSLLREEEESTLARLFTTPGHRVAILTGKMLAVVLAVIVQGGVLLLAAGFAFGVNWGQPATVGLAWLGQVVAASGLGVLLIAFVRTTKQAGPVLGGGLTVLGMLGGLFSAAAPMPEAFARLAVFTPQGWVIKSWQLALEGQPPSALLTSVAVTVLMGVVFFAIGAWRIQRRFA